ncbi:glycosyltransferase [Mycolicibacterium gilvum]|uniref:glycosyltransferase n=1 Tax=Mycolicibacterium gilvum TaxID=1804 RepID=UPI004046280D
MTTDTKDVTAQRIRVMHVVPDLGVGGAERHVTTIMPNLDPDRFATSVVCIGAEGELFGDLAGTDTEAVALHRTKRQAVSALVGLVREMRRFSPDVVLTRGYNAEALGRIAAVIARVPHNVVWVHNHGSVEPHGRLRRVADKVLDRVTSAYFGVAHAQSRYMIEDLHYPADKITVIYNGVDVARFDAQSGDADRRQVFDEFGFAPQDKVVTILAALRPEKDHETYLRAARLVADRLPAAKFLIVGDGRMRPRIEELIDELDLRSRVVLAGTRSDVPALLAVSSVFTLSSYSIECFPMALLEAMAAGVPAVCTAVGGVPEMIDDGVTGFLVPPRDPQAIADAVSTILTDDDLAQKMGRAARDRVEREFSLATSVAATEAALEQLVHPPTRLTAILDSAEVGGAEMLLLNLCKRFDPRQVRPDVVCLREAGPLADEFRAAGVPVRHLERSGKFDVRTLPRLIRWLRANRTDVVLANHHHRASLALGRLAARLVGARGVVAAHDMDLTDVGGRVFPRWAINTMAASDTLVLLTESQGAYLRDKEGLGRSRWSTVAEVVVPNGIDLPEPPTAARRAAARQRLAVSDEDFVVGIVARLSPQKAHEVLFEAIARCRAEIPHIELVVIGGGEREAELHRLAQSFGIDAHTRFLGVRRDVEALMPGFDVVCLSSVHEGVPLTLIEAMAAGVAVVATDCGSVRDIVDDGVQGFVVPVRDPGALADRLTLLHADTALRRRLATAARRRAERDFSIDHTVSGYQQLLTGTTAKDTE